MIASISAFAQPSETQIRNDVGNNGVLSFRFTKSTGTRQWNEDIKNWEYVRGIEVVRNSEYSGIKLIVAGDAVYQYVGNGGYSYWKFRTLSNRYEGIPNPTESEILALINTNPSLFFKNEYFKIIDLIEKPRLLNGSNWIWHKPTSVEFKMKAKYETIISNSETETIEQIYNVRMYRDDLKGPWLRFVSMSSNLSSERKSFGKKSYVPELLRKKPTLQFTSAEALSKQQNASLPKLNLPKFNNFNELVRYTHRLLREGTSESVEAFLRQNLAPRFFVANSKTQLNQEGEQLLKQVLDKAFQHQVTYKMLYCAEPNINPRMSSDKAINILAAINEVGTMIEGDLYNDGYIDGVANKSWKIHRIAIGMKYDDNVLSFINSFTDKRKYCPNDK